MGPARGRSLTHNASNPLLKRAAAAFKPNRLQDQRQTQRHAGSGTGGTGTPFAHMQHHSHAPLKRADCGPIKPRNSCQCSTLSKLFGLDWPWIWLLNLYQRGCCYCPRASMVVQQVQASTLISLSPQQAAGQPNLERRPAPLTLHCCRVRSEGRRHHARQRCGQPHLGRVCSDELKAGVPALHQRHGVRGAAAALHNQHGANAGSAVCADSQLSITADGMSSCASGLPCCDGCSCSQDAVDNQVSRHDVPHMQRL